MKYTYQTHGTCSRSIEFELNDGIVTNVHFNGGCHGNTQGIAALVEGMNAEEVIKRCKDIDCRGRGTSCPAQLSIALAEALESVQ